MPDVDKITRTRNVEITVTRLHTKIRPKRIAIAIRPHGESTMRQKRLGINSQLRERRFRGRDAGKALDDLACFV